MQKQTEKLGLGSDSIESELSLAALNGRKNSSSWNEMTRPSQPVEILETEGSISCRCLSWLSLFKKELPEKRARDVSLFLDAAAAKSTESQNRYENPRRPGESRNRSVDKKSRSYSSEFTKRVSFSDLGNSAGETLYEGNAKLKRLDILEEDNLQDLATPRSATRLNVSASTNLERPTNTTKKSQGAKSDPSAPISAVGATAKHADFSVTPRYGTRLNISAITNHEGPTNPISKPHGPRSDPPAPIPAAGATAKPTPRSSTRPSTSADANHAGPTNPTSRPHGASSAPAAPIPVDGATAKPVRTDLIRPAKPSYLLHDNDRPGQEALYLL